MGLRARGGLEAAVEWNGAKASKVAVEALQDSVYRSRAPQGQRLITLTKTVAATGAAMLMPFCDVKTLELTARRTRPTSFPLQTISLESSSAYDYFWGSRKDRKVSNSQGLQECGYRNDGGAKPGLTAQYFRNGALLGKPETVRTDARIAFSFLADRLPTWAEADGFTARWTGYLTSPDFGDYQIELKGDGGARLWIDGKERIYDWHENGGPARTLTARMEKGSPRRLNSRICG
jgi:hypothetical protein